MRLFRLVVQTGSLSTAGRQLGLSPAAMSGRLKAMEEFYGAPLLKRSTRGLSTTPEGQYLFENSQGILDEVESLDRAIKGGHADLRGTIGITCPIDLGRQYVSQLVDAFVAENPGVTFRIIFSDQVLNFVDRGLDVAIRWGNLPDSSMVARPLGDDRPVACCSPAYLDKHGAPRTPDELRSHNCLIQLRADFPLDRWRFMQDGFATSVQVRGNRMTNDGYILRQWAISGLGLIWKGAWEVGADIVASRLVPVLEDHHLPATRFHLLTDGSKRLTVRVKSFVDFAVQYFKQMEEPARHLVASRSAHLLDSVL
ncbi:LysR family transcriptional regulator [Cupriavidus sp. 30B13]|uniref:LysR family transcriptional regulator n=1 Tax=Cupriavidus sp. 30B13 TaxID=3384241 RepID=UPI003B8F583F